MLRRLGLMICLHYALQFLFLWFVFAYACCKRLDVYVDKNHLVSDGFFVHSMDPRLRDL